MKRSRSEIAAMIKAAARGAGVPLQHAIEWSELARADEAEKAIALFAEALEVKRQIAEIWQSSSAVKVGGQDALQAIPAALDFAATGQSVQYHGAGLDLLMIIAAERGFAVKERALISAQRSKSQSGPIDVPSGVWAKLKSNFDRTLVKSTETSRSGAGAGSIDND